MYRDQLEKYIPLEFDLSKYDATANMELVHWLDNLMKRARSFSCYLSNDLQLNEYEPEQNSISEGFFEFANDGLSSKQLFETNVTNNIEQGAHIDSNVHNLIQAMFVFDNKSNLSVLGSMTLNDLIVLKDRFITQEFEELHSEIEPSIFPSEMIENLGKLNDEIFSFSDDGKMELSWLKVDMNCTDKEIKSAFDDWLKQARTRQTKDIKPKRREHKIKTLNKTTFRKWHDAKVLSYIDIVTWNFLKQNKPTSKIIGEILFPDPRNLADKAKIIEDTVHPYACQLTSTMFLGRMLKLVLADNWEEN